MHGLGRTQRGNRDAVAADVRLSAEQIISVFAYEYGRLSGNLYCNQDYILI